MNLTPADISDSSGAQLILDGVRKRWPWLKHLFADGAYDRTRLLDKAAYLDFVLEIVRLNAEQAGFHVIRRRWVVQRTFGWMTRWRRLVRDYGHEPVPNNGRLWRGRLAKVSRFSLGLLNAPSN
jgi:transposase